MHVHIYIYIYIYSVLSTAWPSSSFLPMTLEPTSFRRGRDQQGSYGDLTKTSPTIISEKQQLSIILNNILPMTSEPESFDVVFVQGPCAYMYISLSLYLSLSLYIYIYITTESPQRNTSFNAVFVQLLCSCFVCCPAAVFVHVRFRYMLSHTVWSFVFVSVDYLFVMVCKATLNRPMMCLQREDTSLDS